MAAQRASLIRRLHGRAHGLDTGRGYNSVEAGRALGVAVADEETELTSVVLQLSHEVARHLHRPGAVRVQGHTEEVDKAALTSITNST